MKAIVLIDAYAQIYRSFYAIRSLTNSRGEPVNALFGMARLLLQLDRSLPSTHGAVLFDRGKPQRRIEICPEYKAQRPPMPDDLRNQLEPIRQWMKAFGWKTMECEGVEADDLIAAIVTQKQQMPVKILSFDKDIAQLLQDEQVAMVSSGKGDEWQEQKKEDVRQKFGVTPDQLGDYLAMLGDSADNIKGVQGVGAKTAAKILQECGSLEKFFAEPHLLKNEKMRQKLLDERELLQRNQELVRLDTTLPKEWLGLETIERQKPDWQKLLELAQEQNFRTLTKTFQEQLDQQRNPQQLNLF